MASFWKIQVKSSKIKAKPSTSKVMKSNKKINVPLLTLVISKKSSVDIKISNILDSKRKSVYESYNATDQIFTQLNPGTEFSIGYSYSF